MKNNKMGILTINMPKELYDYIESFNFTKEEENEFIAKILQLGIDSFGKLPSIRYYYLKKEVVQRFLMCEKLYVLVDCQWALDDKVFHLEADYFLQFAKNCCHDLTKERCVNIISNLKKAIDNQIDWFLTYFGYNYRLFNEKNYPFCKNFVKKYATCDGSYKLRFLDALEILDISTIQKAKQIVYKKCITECYISQKDPTEYKKVTYSRINVQFKPNYLKSKIYICYIHNHNFYRFCLTTQDYGYLEVLKSLLTGDFNYLISYFTSCQIPYEIIYI